MRLQPTITFEQYRDTCQAVAAAKTKQLAKWSWKGYVALGLLCLAVGFSPQIPSARVPMSILFGVIILCWIFSKLLAKRSQEKCLRAIFLEEQGTLNDQVLTIDESGISCDVGSGKVTSHHAWKAFAKRIDMSDAYVYLPSPNSFIRVPKESLSRSEVELVLHWSSSILKGPNR